MKKLRILIPAGLFLIAGLIFVACQKDSPIKGEMIVMGNYESVDCATACLQDGPYYQEKTSWTAKWAEITQIPGYYQNNKYFTTTVWNDEEFFYIKVDVYGYQYDKVNTNNGPGKPVWELTGPTYDNYPFNTVIITLNGNTYTYQMDDPETTEIIETATTYTKAFSLDAGWDKCDAMIYSVRIEGNGQPIWLGTSEASESYTYNLFAPCGCEESFYYVQNTDGTYTFTYIPEEDMLGAELVFTFPQSALDDTPLPGWTYNGQTMQTTMDLDACETYSWTVSLTCKSLNNPQNKWTDFKVNNVSKKGSLENIQCD